MESNQGDRLLRGYLSSRLLLLVIGIITPVGILVVNASAFVMRNLEQFRIGIAICALISSLERDPLLSERLRRFGIRPRKNPFSLRGKTDRGYDRSAFDDAFKRYR